MQTIVCMKWGDRYPSLFVNRLWSSIQRNTNRETRLICYTDNSSGLDSGIITQPMPDIHVPSGDAYWVPGRKLSLFRSDLSDGTNLLSGDILFFDIDMVITGNIDHFFDYHPGEFCIIDDWTRRFKRMGIPPVFRRTGNTSVYRFPFSKYSYIYDTFAKDPDYIMSSYRRSQDYVTSMVPKKYFWPRSWCVSFKRSLLPFFPLNFIYAPRLPKSALCVAFTGHPDQDSAASGGWYDRKGRGRLYRYIRPTLWINEHWR